MKPYKYIPFILFFALFVNGSCEYKEGHRFIIQNNSDLEIIPIFDRYYSISQRPVCVKPDTRIEYGDFIYHNAIKPYSSQNFERTGAAEDLMSHTTDTIYIGVFNRIDIDTMSCEEFKEKNPLKKEWKVTLADMQACDWTLVYEPDSIE